MTRGTIKVKLRPIKLAFLVNPKDKESLLKAIEINTFLWGGMYNPIIPTYKQIPSKWKDRPFENPSAKSVISGYLDNFDPDYVVPIGECIDYNLDIGHRKKIDDVSDILGRVEQDGIPNYGVGLFEVLEYFFTQELKFQRKYPLDICVPHLDTRHSLFLASVFGRLPENIDAVFWQNFAAILDAKKIKCSTLNYAELINPHKIFLRRMTRFYLESTGHLEQCIFYLDATKSLDIIDYWNLRALGWNVLPIPKQFAHSDKMQQLAWKFIEENHVPRYLNPEVYQLTTILKSRSISEDEHWHFCDSLSVSRSREIYKDPKVVLQTWYPRM